MSFTDSVSTNSTRKKEDKKRKGLEIKIYRTLAYAAAIAVIFLSYILIQKENKEDIYQQRIDKSIQIIDKQSSEIETLLNGLSTININSRLDNQIVITPKL
jgi:glucosamine 6-phosphate synthetase-like amidotransferase/phosphosugar isomerase protein